MSFQLTTPVILLIFNRPEKTERVFASIRAAKPSQLLIVADGPRETHPEDIQKCAATRAIVEQVDWECKVERNYSERNLGCKFRVSSGLDWVFSKVETAIILEDDCVPHLTFFHFCEELLDYYRNDKRVMVISGNNFQATHNSTEYSYYFSCYNHCWGWATWRRAWQYYDIEMKLWPKIRDEQWLREILRSNLAMEYWKEIFQAVYNNEINTWDYQWTFSCWLQRGLSILPSCNLVSNIGFDSEATHTHRKTKISNLPAEGMGFPLQHPSFMIRNYEADNFTERYIFSLSLFSFLKRRMKELKIWESRNNFS